jgi:hypothetical protein
MSTRIYTVQQLGGDTRLVRASNQSQALRYVVDKTLSVDLASQDDLVRLLGKGVHVEAANAEDENPSTN